MKVRQVMTTDVYTVRPDASIFDIAELMRDEDIGSVPVVENDRLIGMVTDRDIVVRALADSQDVNKASARSVMSGNLLYCFDDQSVEEVLDSMGEQQVRRMPVVDRDKRLVGMVSIGNLSAAAPADRTGESLSQISQPATHH
jgi:CBS domain-containing protein